MGTGTLVDYSRSTQAPSRLGDTDVVTWQIRGGMPSVPQQIEDALDSALQHSGLRKPDPLPSHKIMERAILLAPGVIVRQEEYERRFASIDLDRIRQRMPPRLFQAFVRHIGAIEGRDDVDVTELTADAE